MFRSPFTSRKKIRRKRKQRERRDGASLQFEQGKLEEFETSLEVVLDIVAISRTGGEMKKMEKNMSRI